MSMTRIAVAIVLCLTCAGAAYAQDASQQQEQQQAQQALQEISRLHWIEGPAHVDAGANATIDVPAGYRYIGPADTARFMELNQNLPPPDGTTVLAPDNYSWFATFIYVDSGYVPDNDKPDADSVLQELKSNQAIANKELTARGWPTMQVIGWKYPPFYDTGTNNLSWAVDLSSSNGSEVINYNTRLLGRTGYTAVTLVADPDNLAEEVGQFKSAITGYQYIPDQAYQAYKPGDKVAKYGLAALITGGAVAVAAKTGLWKVVVGALVAGWKLVAVAIAAVLASFGRIFKRIFSRGKDQ